VTRVSARALRAEWTKLRSVRSTAWLLFGFVGATLALSTMVMLTLDATRCPLAAGCDEDTVRLSMTGVYIGQVAITALAVLAVCGEYGSNGTIMPTLCATPARWRALAAKVLVVIAATIGAGALAIAGTFLMSRLILPDHGYAAPSVADTATARALGGTVLYFGLIAAISLGIAYAVRDTAVSIATVLGLLYVLPIVATLVNNDTWRRWILRLAPMTAGLSIQATKHLESLPLNPWQGLGVLAAYGAVAMLVGGLMFRLRDA